MFRGITSGSRFATAELNNNIPGVRERHDIVELMMML